MYVKILIEMFNNCEQNYCASNILVSCFRHLACEEERVDTIKFLIENGARKDIQNKEKHVPFDVLSKKALSALQTENMI